MLPGIELFSRFRQGADAAKKIYEFGPGFELVENEKGFVVDSLLPFYFRMKSN
jgi:hypothetical protein